MKVSDYIIQYFEQRGVRVIFGYIGGMITHLVDSITQNENIKFVQVYHEQTAAIAAEGYALASNGIGVAISTSGPGVTNMITGIADAYFDSIPVVYISGQVNSYEYKYDKSIRQQGFQETDVVSIVKPITKYAKLVDKEERIRYELDKACHIAQSDRPGPVLLDIPMNIQRAEVDPDLLSSYIPLEIKSNNFDKEEIHQLIASAKHPMILAGAGCKSEHAQCELNKFIERTSVPSITSLMGKGCVDENLPNHMGMVGSYGNRCANMATTKVDLLIALGTRLDTRQTGAMIESFVPKGQIIHVDIDVDELENHRLTNRRAIHFSTEDFLDWLNETIQELSIDKTWIQELENLKENHNQEKEIEQFVENKSPYLFMQALNRICPPKTIYTADIGQNQMWAAQTLKLKPQQQFVTSGGLAPMGFSLPAAVGMSFALPDTPIISINGDGGFHMATQSLMLISQYDLPVKVLVMNNETLGMITQFQQLYFGGRLAATSNEGGYVVPDISKLAEAYSLKYYKINENDLSNKTLLDSIFANRNCIIEYAINKLTTVSPKLEFNKPIGEPSPALNT